MNSCKTDTTVIRAAEPGDLDVLVALCREHATYERVVLKLDGQGPRLAQALFGAPPRLWCLVACLVDGTVVAYATYTRDYSTWRAAEFVHLDCLFVRAQYRGAGIGRRLMEAVADCAHSVGCSVVEWQTPSSNLDAARFYDRLSATQYQKLRYHWKPNRA